MRVRPLVITGSALALVTVLAACGTSSDTSPTTGTMSSSGATAGSTSQSMMPGGTSDIAFAQAMIAHHQQAVEMADLALAHATSAKVKDLATRIKAAQGPEITTMTTWLTAWGQPSAMPSSSDGGMGGMDMGSVTQSGMMSDQDMMTLKAATGTQFDQTWLQMMITHHQGAIAMAQQVLGASSNTDVKTLASSIVSTQTSDVDIMRQMLAGQ